MSIKEFIQLFIPPVFYKVKGILCHRPTPNVEPLSMRERKGDKLIVIGNGPSLSKTIELYSDIMCGTECVMVNFSANTALFEIIKPSIYMLVDPAYYEIPVHLRDALMALYEAIVSKTTWSMTIVMPRSAQDSYAAKRFRENANLNILFFEDGGNLPLDKNLFEAWDNNIVPPPGQTVLNTAVWLSIYWGYKETYIVGADSSILDLRMDQQTNELFTIDTHYYQNTDMYNDMKISEDNAHIRKCHTTMPEEMYNIYLAHKDYWDLRRYADWKGVKVYNASEYSWVDAFERKKLK